MSLAEEEGAGMVTLLQPLLALLILAAGCRDDDTAICLPGEAEKKHRIIVTFIKKKTIHCDIF